MLREFAERVALAALVGAVDNAVHLIFGRCGPSKVSRCAAPQSGVAAKVSGFVLRCRRWAVNRLANQAIDEPMFAIDLDDAIAEAVMAERPRQAVVSLVRDCDGVEKFARRAQFCSPCERVPVFPEPPIMRATQETLSRHFAAALY